MKFYVGFETKRQRKRAQIINTTGTTEFLYCERCTLQFHFILLIIGIVRRIARAATRLLSCFCSTTTNNRVDSVKKVTAYRSSTIL